MKLGKICIAGIWNTKDLLKHNVVIFVYSWWNSWPKK